MIAYYLELTNSAWGIIYLLVAHIAIALPFVVIIGGIHLRLQYKNFEDFGMLVVAFLYALFMAGVHLLILFEGAKQL